MSVSEAQTTTSETRSRTPFVVGTILVVLALALVGLINDNTTPTIDDVPADAPGVIDEPAEPAVQPEPVTEADPAAPEPAQERGDGVGEGIGVHGDWTIEVYDPDGTLADRRDFSNDLTEDGAVLLTDLLLGSTTATGSWRIEVDNSTGSNGPCTTSVCAINGLSGTALVGGGFTITGSTDATATGTIDRVATVTLKTLDGGGSTSAGFTGTLLTTPVGVVSGQSIQVTVDITFGTGIAS